MLKTRIISAIVMLLVFVPILLLGNTYYIIFSSLIGMMALWELERLEKNIPIYMKLLSYAICLFLILYNCKNANCLDTFNYPIIGGILLIYAFSLIINGNLSKYNYKDSMLLMVSSLIIGLLFNGFIRIRIIGLLPVIYAFIISITTDTFAYVGGKLFGKCKLSKEISPNKTIEGSISGSIMGTIMATFFGYYVMGNSNILLLIIMSLTLTIICQVGDLFFSSIKRNYKVKDFSNLIPGHGGILDRLDSVLFVILGYLLYSLVI